MIEMIYRMFVFGFAVAFMSTFLQNINFNLSKYPFIRYNFYFHVNDSYFKEMKRNINRI